MSNDDDDGRKKRIAIIAVSSFLLVAMVLAVTIGVGLNKESEEEVPAEVNSHMKAITEICQPTDYKQTCIMSLNETGADANDPIDLIKAAFRAAVIHINVAANKSTTLHELEKEPRAKMALDQCKELMAQAVDEFNSSINKIGKFEVTKSNQMMADLKVWLSAAISYQETCLDGFQNTTSTAEDKMRKALNISMELSSNGLAIVDQIAVMLQQFNIPSANNRRLLQDNELENELHVLGHGEVFPSGWINSGVRRLLLSHHSHKIKADIVVAQDGSGKFKTINEALEHVPKKENKTFIMYIKEGVYNEYVQINKSMEHLMMVGDGGRKTIITGNKNFIDGVTTFRTCSIAVQADYFIAKNIGFENTAGAIKHQAVALRVQGDKTIFYNCSIDGYQDTLYAHAKRQFYRDCRISGTIDFIFGDAAVVFQNCTFLIRKPLENQQCIITAQGRKERRQPSAIVIQNSTLTADSDLYANRTAFKSYLGRPWKEFSRTVIMESYIDDFIQPDGWMPWQGDFGLQTLFYTEYNNWGPGSSKAKRVQWPGIKSITTTQAKRFTAESFIDGDGWIKPTDVPYKSGLFTKKKVTMDDIIEEAKKRPTINVTAVGPSTSPNSTNTTSPATATVSAPHVTKNKTNPSLSTRGPSMTTNVIATDDATIDQPKNATNSESEPKADANSTITLPKASVTGVEIVNPTGSSPVAIVNVSLGAHGGNGVKSTTVVGQVINNGTNFEKVSSDTPVVIMNATIMAPGKTTAKNLTIPRLVIGGANTAELNTTTEKENGMAPAP
ncbi:hypothetical protein ACFE04_026909 [Oxalis oulophora]